MKFRIFHRIFLEFFDISNDSLHQILYETVAPSYEPIGYAGKLLKNQKKTSKNNFIVKFGISHGQLYFAISHLDLHKCKFEKGIYHIRFFTFAFHFPAFAYYFFDVVSRNADKMSLDFASARQCQSRTRRRVICL